MNVIFNYRLEEIIAGTSSQPEALRKARFVAALGEPWLFGLCPARLENFLAPSEFQVLREYAPEEVRIAYAPHHTTPLRYTRLTI